MKNLNKMFVVVLAVLLFSCGKESYSEEKSSNELNLKANSGIATLMKYTVLNDGSGDNIIDRANCFNVLLPVSVTANGNQIMISSDDDFSTIEAIFDASAADQDILDILFPITIIKNNFSEVVVNNQLELTNLANTCNGEGVADDDIECIDFVYPISASVFNKTNELTSRVIFQNDKQLFVFLLDLNENLIVNIAFPITIMFPDGNTAPIENLVALETTIENAKDDCDEDDDFDYNDDEEEETSIEEQNFSTLITSCVWKIDEAEINGQDQLNRYNATVFTFNVDGSVTAAENGNSSSGTWSIFTINGGLKFTLTFDALTELNRQWNVDEIKTENDSIYLKIKQGEDEIEFKQDCN